MEHRTWQISNGRKAESRFLKREAPQVNFLKSKRSITMLRIAKKLLTQWGYKSLSCVMFFACRNSFDEVNA